MPINPLLRSSSVNFGSASGMSNSSGVIFHPILRFASRQVFICSCKVRTNSSLFFGRPFEHNFRTQTKGDIVQESLINPPGSTSIYFHFLELPFQIFDSTDELSNDLKSMRKALKPISELPPELSEPPAPVSAIKPTRFGLTGFPFGTPGSQSAQWAQSSTIRSGLWSLYR